MSIGDVIIFAFNGLLIVVIAFIGAMFVGGLLGFGLMLGKYIQRTIPDVWDMIPGSVDEIKYRFKLKHPSDCEFCGEPLTQHEKDNYFLRHEPDCY